MDKELQKRINSLRSKVGPMRKLLPVEKPRQSQYFLQRFQWWMENHPRRALVMKRDGSLLKDLLTMVELAENVEIKLVERGNDPSLAQEIVTRDVISPPTTPEANPLSSQEQKELEEWIEMERWAES